MSRMKNHFDSAPPNSENNASLQGFDPEFKDFVDYILKITYQIWEGHQPELCKNYYSDDCPVYMLSGMAVGADEVIENTRNTLVAFPDRTLHADAVLCKGDEINGYHSSHLINTKMTHLGDNELGTASGKQAEFKVIAHCVAKDNKIFKEWLVRDNYSYVEQLGFNPDEIAQKHARIEPEARFSIWLKSEFERVAANTNLKEMQNAEEQLVSSFLHNVWNKGSINAVEQAYSRTAQLHASANRDLQGHSEIKNFYKQFADTFSDFKCCIDDVYQQAYRVHPEDTKEGVHVAARWTISGMHTGDTLYGEPTNSPIMLMGISHYHVVDGKIQEEWAVFDELAILTQIYRARFAHEAS